jgi:tetrahydromethanopterin S-methyltransferase subunit G
MDRRSAASAHDRIDTLDKELVAVKTEVKIQFKEVFTRVKRIEGILVAAAGTIIAMLVAVLMKMG